MNAPFQFTPQATEDLDGIWWFIAEDNWDAFTDYLSHGRRIEVAQKMAGHSNAKTTGLYDRRDDDVSVGEVERIGI